MEHGQVITIDTTSIGHNEPPSLRTIPEKEWTKVQTKQQNKRSAQKYRQQAAELQRQLEYQLELQAQQKEKNTADLIATWLAQFSSPQEPPRKNKPYRASYYAHIMKFQDLEKRRVRLVEDRMRDRLEALDEFWAFQYEFLNHFDEMFEHVMGYLEVCGFMPGVSSETLVPRKPFDECEKCSICLQTLLGGGELTFCAAQCGANFHVECVESWEEHLRRRGKSFTATCAHCRGTWIPGGDAGRAVNFSMTMLLDRWERFGPHYDSLASRSRFIWGKEHMRAFKSSEFYLAGHMDSWGIGFFGRE